MKIGTYVVVRTYSAGVHVGELARQEGKEVTLRNARRVWYWKGAFTLHEIASRGFGDGSKISVSVPEIDLTEVIEVISCLDDARDQMISFKEFSS